MKQAIIDTASGMAANSKTQALASTFTTMAGIGTVLDYLPNTLGVLATISGITLTWMMICKNRLEMKRIKLAIEADQQRIEESQSSEGN